MGCIASCDCFARSSQVQLTEQRVKRRTPADDSQEESDRFKRVRHWVMSLEEIPKATQLAAMAEYLAMNFTDYDNNDENKTQTQVSLESGNVSPKSDTSRRIDHGSKSYEMCERPNFKMFCETEKSAIPSSMKVESGGNVGSSAPIEVMNSLSLSPNVLRLEGSEGNMSIWKSEGQCSATKESHTEPLAQKNQLVLPGRTVRSSSPENSRSLTAIS